MFSSYEVGLDAVKIQEDTPWFTNDWATLLIKLWKRSRCIWQTNEFWLVVLKARRTKCFLILHSHMQ